MTTDATATVERAREIVRRAHAINPSPSLLRIEEKLRSGDTSARQLAKLTEGSPALAARVLRMANSGFYAPQEPVVSLSRAVAMLGDTVLRQLVLTSLIASRRASSRSPRQALAAARLMADAVRSAVVSRDLAVATRSHETDSAFAAGLLHDLGHVYLLDEMGDPYTAYVLAADEEDPSLAAEIAIAGTTHEEIGAVFAYEWNLPPSVGRVLWDHHRPAVGSLSYLVHVGDRLVRELSRPEVDDPLVQVQADLALASLGLDRDRWMGRVQVVRAQIEELLSLFDAQL
jgi:HD-like signal output (HDOD) protein